MPGVICYHSIWRAGMARGGERQEMFLAPETGMEREICLTAEKGRDCKTFPLQDDTISGKRNFY